MVKRDREGQPLAPLWQFGRISKSETSYRKNVVRQAQKSCQCVGVVSYRAYRTGAEPFGLGSDYKRGKRNSGIDRCVEKGIQMVVGEFPVAQGVDTSLPSIVSTKDQKVWKSFKPFLTKAAACKHRPYLCPERRRVYDDDVALL
jgi:hypothetical protein